MRCIIPQITWNSREPVLSIDFDPSCKYEDGFYRLASGGADKQLLIWHIRDADTLKPNLLCVAELKRHLKTVNVVRFSPDGNYIASGDDDAFVFIWKNETKSDKEETWLVEKTLRRHLEDVSDLCWSPDGAFLVSGSVDNSAVLWDVKKGTALQNWSDHVGFVNGVSYDPFHEYVVTMCIDRTLRFFNPKSGKLIHKLNKFSPPWLDESAAKNNILDESAVKTSILDESAVKNILDESTTKNILDESTTKNTLDESATNNTLDESSTKNILDESATKNILDESAAENKVLNEAAPKVMANEKTTTKEIVVDEPMDVTVECGKENEIINPDEPVSENVKKFHGNTPLNRMFCDADDTFCRRMTFSPKGELLMVPGGLLPPRNSKESLAPTAAVINDGTLASSPGDGKLKTKNKMKKFGEKPATNNNAILIFCRNSMLTPCAVIPTGTSLSTVIRFSPMYYERSRSKFTYDSNFANPTAKVERMTACVGRIKPPTKNKRMLMETPYRLVYAVATHDSIIIGDTASPEPLVNIKNIHCTRITDVSWSADGRVCVSSSTDGYCSIITFEKDELGIEFPLVQVSSGVSDCFPVSPPKKLKPKTKKKKEPKQKPMAATSPISKVAEKAKVEISIAVEENAEGGDVAQSQSPKSTVKPVQKNTLLKWVIKKPKSEEESNGAVDEKAKFSGEAPVSENRKPVTEPELICLDSNSCEATPMDVEFDSIKSGKETGRKITSFFKNHANRSEINHRELLKLQTAPLKNTELLEASISENIHGGIPMEVEPVGKSSKNLNPKPVIEKVKKSEATSSESQVKSGANPSTNLPSTNKTSPVSSSTPKPPRRIQLITLTAAAPKKAKGNLD